MQLKFLCPCGTKYAFEFEPVNGRMPWAVKCPSCGADATEHANTLIQQSSTGTSAAAPAPAAAPIPAPTPEAPRVRVNIPAKPQPAPGAPVVVEQAKVRTVAPASAAPAAPPAPTPVARVRVVASAPAAAPAAPPSPAPAGDPLAARPAPAPPAVPSGPGRLRLGAGPHAPAAQAEVAATSPAAATTTPTGATSVTAGMMAKSRASSGLPREQNFGLGLMGAVLGGLLGAIAWFLVVKFTGMRLKILAVGVGALTGLCAKLLAGRVGSRNLGIAASACALLFILLGMLLIAKARVDISDEDVVGDAAAEYDRDLARAKDALKQMPNQTDFEIRGYLAKEASKGGESVLPSSITEQDIKFFRDEELKQMRELVSGKLTRETYRKEAKKGLEDFEESGASKILLLLSFANIFRIGTIVLGVGAAYKAAEA